MYQQTTIIKSGKGGNPRSRLLIVTPTLGIVRIEWSIARYRQAVPCNWVISSASFGIGCFVPMHYLTADAQNLGCGEMITRGAEWLLFWEDDVLPPFDALLQLNKYITTPDIPVVSGLYFTKSSCSEPMIYRELGSGSFCNFKIGDKIWAASIPTGFLLVHSAVIKLMWKESKEYTTLGERKARNVFVTSTELAFDPETREFTSYVGTSDRLWCERVIEEDILTRAGFPEIGQREWPFLCDTGIFCKHIDLMTGRFYPPAEIIKKYANDSLGQR